MVSIWRWTRSAVPRSPWALAPGLRELRGYRRGQLRPDLLAGVTVAAVAVPAGLATGELAGLSPVAGLYATMWPLVAYALYASSRQIVVGPDGTLAVLTATTVAPLAGGGAARYAALAAALAMIVGLILLVSAALRLGFMADFLSIPILLGYFNGIALIIIASQVGKVFGLSISADYFFGVLREFITEVGQIQWLTATLSLALLPGVWWRSSSPAWPR
jgi:SulP family sulfate permease